MKAIGNIILLSLTTSIIACKTVPKTVQRIPFPIHEYKKLNTKGSGSVVGQAFLKTRGGDVKKAAGNQVWLNPITSYSKQWYESAYKKHMLLSQEDPRYEQYVLTEIADADGRFHFTNVPPGRYYLVTTVIWEAPIGYNGSLVPQGGLICKKVNVKNDKQIKVILTR